MATDLKDNRLSFNSTSIGEVNSKLDILPVGFVYIQFPNQSAPGDILAGTWEEITSQYAGLFFRAEGGNANPFGSGTQAEGLPNITGRIGGDRFGHLNTNYFFSEGCFYATNSGQTSAREHSSHKSGVYVNLDASRSNSIYGASSHVTPVNTSIRIWKRTA